MAYKTIILMTRKQRAYLLEKLHSIQNKDRHDTLNIEMKHFGLSDSELHSEILKTKIIFNDGIRNLNSNQLNNILNQLRIKGSKIVDIKKRLGFYEIDEVYHQNIIQFLEDYILSDQPIDVGDLDIEFKGVQVASRDNFNLIINQGWTGDWVLTPENIEPRRVQVASMNDTGNFPRGCYLNANIVEVEPVHYNGQIRYRIFIDTPTVINTGNRNVKFNLNPVRYIK